jgi:Icc-related predicted phosphoesterase
MIARMINEGESILVSVLFFHYFFSMKLLILADIDSFRWQWEKGQVDLIISCGDVSDQLILEASEAFNCPRLFAVKGNHDSNMPFSLPIIDLHLITSNLNGFTFGGLNGSWKYKPKGYFLYEQNEVSGFLKNYSAVNVFVSHNSPLGIHDKQDEVHNGFKGLNEYIERTKPKLLIHGHQHCNKETVVGETRVIGVYGHRILEI